MTEEFEKLFRDRHRCSELLTKIQKEIDNVREVKRILEKREMDVPDVLLKLKDDLDSDLTKTYRFRDHLARLINLKQNECKHQMTYIGHDSHKDYYKCGNCGYEESI